MPVIKPNNPINEQDKTAKYIKTKGLWTLRGTKIRTNKETEAPTNSPLHIAPAKKAEANSMGVNGGNNKSVILPATFALNKEDEVLPNAF